MASTAADQPKIKLYWLEQSRSQRILWLLEELSLEYELEIFHRNPKTRLAPPELQKVHALGKSPVISITGAGSSTPVIIAESANIAEYLLDHFGQNSTLLPKRYREGEEGKVGGETEEWLRFRYFMHYAEGSLMGLMTVSLIALSIQHSPAPFFIKPITNNVASKISSNYLTPSFKTHLSFLESQLATAPGPSSGSGPGSGTYLCGPRLTAADILLSFPLIAAARGRAALTAEEYPLLGGYVSRLESEPGYRRAADRIVEIEGKFEATFKL